MVAPEPGVNLPDRGPRLDADPGTPVKYLDITEMPPHIDQQPFADGLAGETGAAGAQGQWPPGTHRDGHGQAHLGGIAGTHDRLGSRQVVGRVYCHGEPVQGPGAEADIWAQAGRQLGKGLFGSYGLTNSRAESTHGGLLRYWIRPAEDYRPAGR